MSNSFNRLLTLLIVLVSVSVAMASEDQPRYVIFPPQEILQKSLVDAGYDVDFLRNAKIVEIINSQLTALEVNNNLKSRLLDYYKDFLEKQRVSSQSGEIERTMAIHNKPELLNLLFQCDLEALKRLERSDEYKNEDLHR